MKHTVRIGLDGRFRAQPIPKDQGVGASSTHRQAVYSVALLVLAGADVDRIVEHVDRSRGKSRDGYQRR